MNQVQFSWYKQLYTKQVLFVIQLESIQRVQCVNFA